MNYTKVIGWILLLAGAALIGWILLSSYNIFTGKTEAPIIFKAETEEKSALSETKNLSIQAEIQKEMEKMIGEQLKGLLPFDTLPRLLNLTVWTMLAWILIFGGAQISGLGIKLIKNQ